METTLVFLNLTNLDLDWTDPYNQLNGNHGVKAMIITFQSISLMAWTVLAFGIISHERFGGDPQKRGLLNQVRNILMWLLSWHDIDWQSLYFKTLSQTVAMLLVFSWFYVPIITWRIIGGPIVGRMFWMFMLTSSLVTFFLGFAILEYCLIKFLAIVVMKRMLTILDDIFALFSFLCILLISGLLAGLALYNTDSLMFEKRFAGLPPSFHSKSNLDLK